jgi:hypothetical protein
MTVRTSILLAMAALAVASPALAEYPKWGDIPAKYRGEWCEHPTPAMSNAGER